MRLGWIHLCSALLCYATLIRCDGNIPQRSCSEQTRYETCMTAGSDCVWCSRGQAKGCGVIEDMSDCSLFYQTHAANLDEVEGRYLCSLVGNLSDGQCTCNEGHYGQNCEFNLLDPTDDTRCIRPGPRAICEGRGTCENGHCVCFPLNPADPNGRTFTGQFCECRDDSCYYYNQQSCGGEEHGTCVCGECRCESPYTGLACECDTSTESCMAANGLLCNGKGICRCGVCHCELDTFYRGPTCEDCPVCIGQCDSNRACVECVRFGSDDLSPEACETRCAHVTLVDHVEDTYEWRECRFEDADGCPFHFIYNYDDGRVKAEKTSRCPEKK